MSATRLSSRCAPARCGRADHGMRPAACELRQPPAGAPRRRGSRAHRRGWPPTTPCSWCTVMVRLADAAAAPRRGSVHSAGRARTAPARPRSAAGVADQRALRVRRTRFWQARAGGRQLFSWLASTQGRRCVARMLVASASGPARGRRAMAFARSAGLHRQRVQARPCLALAALVRRRRRTGDGGSGVRRGKVAALRGRPRLAPRLARRGVPQRAAPRSHALPVGRVARRALFGLALDARAGSVTRPARTRRRPMLRQRRALHGCVDAGARCRSPWRRRRAADRLRRFA